jgi:Tfp pilus assembly protein PilF
MPNEDGGGLLWWTAAGLLALLLAGCAGGGPKPVTADAEQQLKFGVNMAQRGLWSEALFRFEQAQALDPNNARVLNNLAIAHEAVGEFDKALALYKQALKLDPSDVTLKRNYTRFSQFYESFRPRKADDQEAAKQAPAQSEEADGQAGGQPPEKKSEQKPDQMSMRGSQNEFAN